MADFKNLVVLGDSMSDIGNKWLWPTGELGRLFGAMRVNETGRFSDGKNWTDLLVEWATGETLMWGNRDLTIRKSSDYRTLSSFSVLSVNPFDQPAETKINWSAYLDDLARGTARQTPTRPPLPELTYVNYAMGGAIVTNDWSPKFGALTHLRSQAQDYLAQRAVGRKFVGDTLHIIWIGLNDFVTAKRPDYDTGKVRTAPANADYQAWETWSKAHPESLADGVGVFPAVAELRSLVELINADTKASANNYFMLVDLPSIYSAIRYMEGIADAKKIEEARLIDPVMRRYNDMLASLVQSWPAGDNAPAAGHVSLVRMSSWMDQVSRNLEQWNLSKKSQSTGVRVFYRPGLPGEPTTDPVGEDMRRRITTSDLGHPTEAVYAIMARYIASELLKGGHTLGRLASRTWPARAPFPALPFDVQ